MNARPPVALTQAGYARAIRFAATSTGHSVSEVRDHRRSEPTRVRHQLWAALSDLGISGAAIARAAGMDHSTINSAMQKLIPVDPGWAAGVRNAIAPTIATDSTEAELDDLHRMLSAAIEAVNRIRAGRLGGTDV